MTRQMADAVTPATFPWADLVAGYIDGRFQSFAGMAAANPGKRAVSIATQASTRGADVYDCEAGDLTAWQLVDSIAEDRTAGRWPSGYFSEASRATVETSFSVRGVPLPPIWEAGYPGSVGYGNLYPGSVAHQDADLGDVDHSTVIDNPPGWPGIDPPPPQPNPDEEEPMGTYRLGASVRTVSVDKDGNVIHRWWNGAAWVREVLLGPASAGPVKSPAVPLSAVAVAGGFGGTANGSQTDRVDVFAEAADSGAQLHAYWTAAANAWSQDAQP